MATFKINGAYTDARTVEATHFTEVNSFVIFYTDRSANKDTQVFALPVAQVRSIERVEPAK